MGKAGRPSRLCRQSGPRISKFPRGDQSRKAPTVRIAQPTGRPYQIRYHCPVEGREIRISTGTYDRQEAEQQKTLVEAKLLLGLPGQKPIRKTGPTMRWSEFREEYRELQLTTLRDRSAESAESRLDIAECIMQPRTLADMASPEALHQLQAKLLSGAESRRGKPRSPHTVRAYMAVILAALRWAHAQGWLEKRPTMRRLKVAKLKSMRGRPITTAEFQRMLDATEAVVGTKAAPSWRYLLRGLWTSALRSDELMHVSWNIDQTIRPMRRKDHLPVLQIPAAMQKNDTEESIPLLPWFEELLMETPIEQRTGWVFNPAPLPRKFGNRKSPGRPDVRWVGKVISRIGKAADVTVDAGDQKTGRPTKYASAHDLRRSCAERLLDSGLPHMVIARILRHTSWETTKRHYVTGSVQKDAKMLKEYLGTVSTDDTAQKEPSRS